MNNIKFLSSFTKAKDLAIGEYFIYSEYFGTPIEWRKIDEHLVISEKVLDCIIFNSESNREYNESLLFKWCKMFEKQHNTLLDKVTILDYDEILKYFPTDESRQAEPTEWAIMHGASVAPNGKADYWTSTVYGTSLKYALVVNSFGKINDYIVNHSRVCVRPALQIR